MYLLVRSRGSEIRPAWVHRQAPDWPEVRLDADYRVGDVRRPHGDAAIGVAETHDSVPGILTEHVAGAEARAVLCDDGAMRRVLIRQHACTLEHS